MTTSPLAATDPVEIVKQGVLALAGRCDFARSLDGAGFNRYDAPAGHDLARAIEVGQAVNAVFALKLITKYRKQLGAAGLTLPDEGAVREIHDARRAAAPAQPTGIEIARAGASLRVRFAYDPALVETMKGLPGRRFDPGTKAWLVPASALTATLDAFPGAALDPGLGEEVEAARREIETAIRGREAQRAADLAAYEAIREACSLYDHQDVGARWLIEHRRGIVADDMGLGKALADGTPVLTPTGWKPIEQLHAGDPVIAADGTATKVTAVYPQGVRPLYRITFSDGISVDCDAEHLWRVSSAVQRKRASRGRVLTTAQILKEGIVDAAGNRRFFVPIVEPVEFEPPQERLPIDPYLLGVLLGDAYVRRGEVVLTSGDRAVFESVAAVLPGGVTVHGDGLSRRLATVRAGVKNPLLRNLKALGVVGKRAHEKRVPNAYLVAAIAERFALLQGLMDTDGYAAKDGTVQFTTTSRGLADDVEFLVQALGGIARTSRKTPSFSYRGQRRTGRLAYTLTLALPNRFAVPFRLDRKAARARTRVKYQPSRAIASIERCEAFTATCIAVKHPGALYVTKGCVVTHNTRQSLVAARALGYRIIVVAPAGLRINWLREAEMVDAQIEIYSWAKVPEPPEGDFTLIADEAHYAQNLKASRTKKFLALAKAAQAVFPLTGTPIKNGRPANLYPLLLAINHDLVKDRSAYERRYCEAKATRWSRWDVTGAAHLDELHRKISDAVLRRMKGDCLDLPELVRVARKVELSPAAQERYNAVLHKLQAEYRRRKDAGEISEADTLVLMNHLYHAGSLAKVESAVELAQEVIEQGGQVVLAVGYLDSAAQIADALHAGRVTGEETAEQRQAAIDEFQAGRLKAMVCSLGAGNVGITLTAAQTVLLVDRPWTPGDAEQMEARLHRIGQRGSVLAVWLQANGADEARDAVLQQKHERIELVLAGKRRTLRGIGSIGDVAEAVLGGAS